MQPETPGLVSDTQAALTKLGDHIEALRELGCRVSLRVSHNDGSEGIELHDLTGEFSVRVERVESLMSFGDSEIDCAERAADRREAKRAEKF